MEKLNITWDVILMILSSGSFTCHPKKPVFNDHLQEAKSLIIPSALQFANPIFTPNNQTHNHHLLFLEGCNLPIGMIWTIGTFISATNIRASLQEVSPWAFQTLSAPLKHPLLVDSWLTAVSNQPAFFVANVICYSSYPDITTNGMPTFIACHHSIAPWMDMKYLFIWRIVLDCIRAQPNPEVAADIHCYIQYASTALYPSIYTGDIQLADMFPNMGYCV